MSIYAFGDIHGELFKLEELMKKVHPSKVDQLIFLGDYTDRGPRSYEVIEFLIQLNKNFDCVFIKGNHELMFMNYLSGLDENMFLFNGGKITLNSYLKHGVNLSKDYVPKRNLPKKHFYFYNSLKLYYETEDFIFTHAGINTKVSLQEQDEWSLLWSKDFDHIEYSGKTVVYGHNPSIKILNEPSKICLDTGSCYDDMGVLSCMKLPERTVYQQSFTLRDLGGD